MKTSLKIIISLLIITGIVGGYFLYRSLSGTGGRSISFHQWISDPLGHPDWTVKAGSRCGEAPFILPTNGYIGFLWDDSFRIGHRHQGIDIFGGGDPGQTPVIAAYDGYLTRLPDWKSTVIMRIPSDPLQPGWQIWTYYTHMADQEGNSFIAPEFPPGVVEVFVKAGTTLGHQGNYSGTPDNPVGVHLHFSIVRDDGTGKFTNELDINNTYDPSPYLGLNLNANNNRGEIPLCSTTSQ